MTMLTDEKIKELVSEASLSDYWYSHGDLLVQLVHAAIEAAVQQPVADLMCQWKGGKISGDELADRLFSLFASSPSSAVLEAQKGQEPAAWPVMGYGQVAIGGGKQPNGMSALLYLKMGEAREINADTTDLFPVGSEVAPDKLMACVYFKDGAAMQQTIDVLREMQQEIGYAAHRARKERA